MGVWALITQSLINTLFQTILLLYFVKWIPLFVFSIDSFKSLFPFSFKIDCFSTYNVLIYHNLYSLVIGKGYSSSDLGLYSRAETFSQFPANNISAILSRVSFPVLSSVSDDEIRIKKIYKQYLQLTAFLVFPIMFFLIGIANPLIEFLLTDKWLGTVNLLCKFYA